MDRSDIYEKFEATQWDYDNEFNPKRGKRQSKKQQTYGESCKSLFYKSQLMFNLGVFASSESEEEEEAISSKKFPTFVKSNETPATESIPTSSSSRQSSTSKRFQSTTNTGPIGTWEKHTKGIGARLLAKMGYKPGLGLGKELQGITAPIDAKLRPSGVGLGLVEEHKPKVVFGKDILKPEVKGDDEGEDMDLASDYEGSDDENRKRMKRKRTKKEYVTRSAEEILTERMSGGFTRNDQLNIMSTKVIDMRGPESKVLSSYHEIDIEKLENESEDSVYLRRNERDLVINQAEMKKVENQLDNLNEQRKSIKKSIQREKQSLSRMEALNEMAEKLRKEKSTLTPLLLVEMYHDCKENYGQEFKTFNMDIVFRTMITDSFKGFLNSWRPLTCPEEHKEVFERLKQVLHSTDRKLFETILWNHWMPRVRREIVSWPSIKACNEIIYFLESWKPIIPTWLFANLMDQMILPRIEREIEEWNPCTDPIPVHSWILPWIPLTGDGIFSPVFITIRRKLGAALKEWHASDSSAKLILEPWKSVFSPAIWDSFLSNCIIPKLSDAIATLVINPRDQAIDNWNWFIAWYPLASPILLTQVLCQHFFPRWLQVLHQWLNSSPDFAQVSNWYSGWKSMLPQELQEQPPIQAHFLRAQKMMYDAINGHPVVLDIGQNQHVNPEQLKFRKQLLTEAASATNDSKFSFKQLVSDKADKNGIIFMPVSNKYQEGKQVYQLGDDRVYLDRSVVFVHNPDTKKWNPTSLSTLFPG